MCFQLTFGPRAAAGALLTFTSADDFCAPARYDVLPGYPCSPDHFHPGGEARGTRRARRHDAPHARARRPTTKSPPREQRRRPRRASTCCGRVVQYRISQTSTAKRLGTPHICPTQAVLVPLAVWKPSQIRPVRHRLTNQQERSKEVRLQTLPGVWRSLCAAGPCLCRKAGCGLDRPYAVVDR